MHKYFAKPLILGKQAEFLPECHSTNEELMNRVRFQSISEGYLMHSDFQKSGKGQRGSSWSSDRGENLLFSLFLQPKQLKAEKVYLINVITGLAVAQVLQEHLDSTIELKWPNDLYVNDCKIGGILIETILLGENVDGCVVGVGLNINQTDFNSISATSLRNELKRSVNRFEILENILLSLEQFYFKLKAGEESSILRTYHSILRWKGELHFFEDAKGLFQGEIIGINASGKLVVNGRGRSFAYALKEIKFIN